MVFNVHTMKEEPCCKNPSCQRPDGDPWDCEECGSHCDGCKYPAYKNWVDSGEGKITPSSFVHWVGGYKYQ